MFENLNNYSQNLTFLEGLSAQELLDQIKQIKLPVQILSIYAVGSKHVAWIVTTAKINKVKKEK